MPKIQAIVFDAYGTLFDVHSISKKCSELFPDKGEELSRIWRSKQLEYTWLRSLMGRYSNFHQVTIDALMQACRTLDVSLDEDKQAQLMDEYLKLSIYSEVAEVLQNLKNIKKVIFTNGNQEMVRPLIEYRGLTGMLDGVLTSDSVKTYKPDPKAYTVVLEQLKVSREEVLFVSSNPWDAAGAKSFGFHVAWINRGHQKMDELGQAPDIIISDLHGILDFLK
ncbi:haloacid dehalogenase type II [Paenibacillus filicis]|uniref:Haloacid dehalogenase type II n=1 Tax=Paenibacillus gyeongsangnamensis TaxID=3388067 RepID=A0ABT4QES3_9BACL|nr:haloacid dehalogenase type II [Paenibacillus filicis]MCZ8515357.1 haloacid dehalogenase type II [Paenibacillus filicis]